MLKSSANDSRPRIAAADAVRAGVFLVPEDRKGMGCLGTCAAVPCTYR
jgi:hypothetical protein